MENDEGLLGMLNAAPGLAALGVAGAASYQLADRFWGADQASKQADRSGFAIDRATQSKGTSLVSTVMALEEASPLHLLRTLQLSNLMQPFALMPKPDEMVHISGTSLRGQQFFYESMLRENVKSARGRYKRLLQAEDLKNGMIFHKNKLYGVDAKTGAINMNDVVMQDARLVFANQVNGGSVSRNLILEKYANGFGATIDKRAALNDPLMVIGGNSSKQTIGRHLNAYLKTGMEMGYKALDNPVEGIENLISGFTGGLYGESNPNSIFNTDTWKKAKSLANIQLGTGGNYSLGHADSLKRMTKNMVIKGGGAYLGYQLLDSAARGVAGEDSSFNSGLFAGIGGMYVDARIGFAKMWSNRFQGYRERQEHNAQGSTDLTTLMGLPLAGALLGAQIGFMQRSASSMRNGAEFSAQKYGAEVASPLLSAVENQLGGLGKSMNLSAPKTIMRKNATIGLLAGAIPVLPFLPGALIGKSSQELEDIYSGRKEESVKAARGWFFGGGKLEGGHDKYYKKNWFAMANAESETKGEYGSAANKKKVNPFLHPISYLRNPYKYEEMTAETKPYPIWGMEVGSGSFMGKAYERTIGQIIKPDVVNPKIALAQKLYGDAFEKEKKNPTKVVDPYEGIDPNKYNANGIRKGTITREVDIDKEGYKVKVDDGDTLILTRGKEKLEIRMSGVDTPETDDHKDGTKEAFYEYIKKQAFGKGAANLLRQETEGKSGLKVMITEQDKYGRSVGVVMNGDRNVNLELLKQGAGSGLPFGEDPSFSPDMIKAAEAEAIKNERGVWAYSRYKAQHIFNEISGQTQTNNTLAKSETIGNRMELQKLSEELNLPETRKGALTSSEESRIKDLAVAYKMNTMDQYEGIREDLRDVGLEVQPRIDPGHVQGIKSTLNFKNEFNENEQDLIATQDMKAKAAPTLSAGTNNLGLAYQSLTDFVGIKGWVASMVVESIHKPEEKVQLARSGESSNIGRRLGDMNVGDMMGLGESSRKFIGQSGAALPTTVNQMKNSMPTWLPGNNPNTKYYIDFSKGDPYALIENGASRLPGKGFEALNPAVKGLKAEEYPDIFKYKILSDVAKGSAEHIRMREKLVDRYRDGKMSKPEIEIFTNSLDQEAQRDQRKKFFDDTRQGASPIGVLQNSLWRTIASISNPLEMATPLRPIDKFIHLRTATDDYRKTQLGGDDTAIWTNPVSHFIKPMFNRSRLLAEKDFKPKEAVERDNINEYFDKLGYVKSTFNNDKKAQRNSVIESSLMGLNTKEKVLNFKAGLTDNQRDYFHAFSKETSKQKREEILAMLPGDVARGYQQIWKNLDLAEDARKKHRSVQKTLAEQFLADTRSLEQNLRLDLKVDRYKIEEIKQTIKDNKDSYADMGFSNQYRTQLAIAEEKRRQIAQKEAFSFVKGRTGAPSGTFAGWDPRLTMKDIKIKTLSVGKEDLKRYGFWKDDEDRMNRLMALDEEKQVINQIDQIKREIGSERRAKGAIENALFRKGFITDRVHLDDSGINSILLKNND